MRVPGQYGGSSKSGSRGPKESRRWLKPRVPKEQLYKLAPRRPRPKPFGQTGATDRVRSVLRSWHLWLAISLCLYWFDRHVAALITAAVTYIVFETSAKWHPAIYPLDTRIDIDTEGFHVAMAGVTGMPLIPGNRVVIYNNGDEFFPAMLEAIESATQSITMEQYIFWDDEVGRRFAEAFAQQARRGVSVKLLLDAIGSSTLGDDIFKILENSGCQLAWFRPIQWYTLKRAHTRNHRKSIIIDGRIAFTGGAGLAVQWLGSAMDPTEWRDVQIGIEGPAAMAQQTGFVQNWMSATGEIVAGPQYFPTEVSCAAPPSDQPNGGVEVQTILSSPATGAGAAGTMYMVALQCSKRSLCIANSYFIPDSRVIAMLAQAAKRNVTVTLLVAGTHNDTWWARQNSVRRYGDLLRAGVQIYEFQPSMLHQKVMIVDGVWATVGTTNFDNRSFALNEETNICIHDPGLVKELQCAFFSDLERSKQVHLHEWEKRGLWQKAQEQWAALVEDQM